MEHTTEKNLKKYISFCKRFRKYNIPQLRFKESPPEYKKIYRSIYDIHEEDVCKATFVVFFVCYLLICLMLISLTRIPIFYCLIIPFIFSTIISYSFNLVLYKRIKRDEKIINALLYLVRINFSLMKKTLKENADLCVGFIGQMIDYDLPISDAFIEVYNRIHLGYTPEKELEVIITPSSDFNQFKKELLVKNFDYDYESDFYNESTSEKQFKILIRSLESKMGLMFFAGLFIPLGLSFFILFQEANLFFTIFMIPFFLYLLHYMFKKLIKVDVLLIGLLNEYSGPKKIMFDEFILFLETLALNLEKKTSPEIAFINSYSENISNFSVLKQPFDSHISYLINLQYTFRELINRLKGELGSPRYRIILDIILNMLERSATYSSKKVKEIVKIIQKHRKYEERFNIIIKGNKFVVMIFIFMFPAILGTIGGMLPLVIAISRTLNNTEYASFQHINEIVDIKDVIVIFAILLACNIVTCYYFLKIIQHKRSLLVISISSAIFVLSFVQGVLFMFASI